MDSSVCDSPAAFIENRLCTLVSCLQMVSYAVDYFPRKAALAALVVAPQGRDSEDSVTSVTSVQLAQR